MTSGSGDSGSSARTDLFHGLFLWHEGHDGKPRVSRHAKGPASVPCPTTGRQLRIATIEAEAAAICPSCSSPGAGGFVSFEGDLRMAYACPSCLQFVWLAGV
jgi:hypothetical protein